MKAETLNNVLCYEKIQTITGLSLGGSWLQMIGSLLIDNYFSFMHH